MNKLSTALQKASFFYKQAMLALGADPTAYVAQEDLLDESDNFEPINEDLSQKYALFMNAYREYLYRIMVTAKEVAPNIAENMFINLNKELNTIKNMPYLEENNPNYSEQFDGDEFLSFLDKVEKDIAVKIEEYKNIKAEEEAKKRELAGPGKVETEEDKATALKKLIKEQDKEKKTDTEIKPTIEKTSPIGGGYEPEDRPGETDFEAEIEGKIKDIGRDKVEEAVGIGHGRQTRIKQDPNDPEVIAYKKELARQRQIKFLASLEAEKKRVNELTSLLSRIMDPEKKKKISDDINQTSAKIEKKLEQTSKTTQKKKEIKEGGGLAGAIENLRVKIKTQKGNIHRAILRDAIKLPIVIELGKKIEAAQAAYESDPFPVTKRALDAATQERHAAIDDFINNFPSHVAIEKANLVFSAYRKKLSQVASIIEPEQGEMPQAIAPTIKDLITSGNKIIELYSAAYSMSTTAVQQIVDILSSKEIE